MAGILFLGIVFTFLGIKRHVNCLNARVQETYSLSFVALNRAKDDEILYDYFHDRNARIDACETVTEYVYKTVLDKVVE